jgi:hypothetical protein
MSATNKLKEMLHINCFCCCAGKEYKLISECEGNSFILSNLKMGKFYPATRSFISCNGFATVMIIDETNTAQPYPPGWFGIQELE